MTGGSEFRALRELATLCGVQLAYRDASGVRRTASTESLRAVLSAVVGHEVARLAEEAGRLRAERESSMLAPVSVVWRPGRARVALRPGSARSLSLELEAEDGSVRGWNLGADDVQREPDGTQVVSLPEELPQGYYRLRARAGRRKASSLLICAPRRAYRDPEGDRDWGVFLPLYAVRSRRSQGIGDFTDLRDLVAWIESLGGSAVGTLPLLAQFYKEPLFDPSPYTPASRLMWNELYVDLQAVAEFQAAAIQPHSAPAVVGDYVDYGALYSARRAALEAMQRAMSTGRRAELRAYLRSRPEVASYAGFRARTEAGGPWTEWPEDDAGPEAEDDRDFHAYAQWLAEAQMSALSSSSRSGLYLDLPLGVHRASFDTWRWPDCFLPDLNAGAPPDPLATGGQDWGFPPLHPQGNRASSYEYVIAYLRHHMRCASRLRIDHVMGLHRLFVIPRGAPASQGVYLRYPAEELYALLCLESHRQRTEIVGENLGTVPGYVNRAMTRHGFSGMYVLPFEIDIDGGRIRPPPADSAASLNTHDLPTFAGWWSAADIEDRRQMGWFDERRAADELRGRDAQKETLARYLVETGFLTARSATDAPEVRDGLLRFLAESPARLVLASLEDLWGETRPQNVPGTSAEKPNWRRRGSLSLEEMQSSPEVAAALGTLNAGRMKAGGQAGDAQPARRR